MHDVLYFLFLLSLLKILLARHTSSSPATLIYHCISFEILSLSYQQPGNLMEKMFFLDSAIFLSDPLHILGFKQALK